MPVKPISVPVSTMRDLTRRTPSLSLPRTRRWYDDEDEADPFSVIAEEPFTLTRQPERKPSPAAGSMADFFLSSSPDPIRPYNPIDVVSVEPFSIPDEKPDRKTKSPEVVSAEPFRFESEIDSYLDPITGDLRDLGPSQRSSVDPALERMRENRGRVAPPVVGRQAPMPPPLNPNELVIVKAEPFGANLDPKRPKISGVDKGFVQSILEGTKDTAHSFERAAVKGTLLGIPEGIIGLLDLASGGRAGQAIETHLIDFEQQRKDFDRMYPEPERLAVAKEAFQKEPSIIKKAVVALTSPTLIADAIGESLPLMVAGGAAGRAAAGAATMKIPGLSAGASEKLSRFMAKYAGPVGEAAIAAGSAAEGIRQQNESGLLTGGQSALAAGSGLATGILGAIGQKLARAWGLEDIDAALAGAAVSPAAKRGLAKRLSYGFLQEGVLEELPQSIQEQFAQNLALGKPLNEGVADAAILGLVTGGFMGAGMNAPGPVRGSTTASQRRQDTQPEVPASTLPEDYDTFLKDQTARYAQIRVLEDQLKETKSEKRIELIQQELTGIRRQYEDAYQAVANDKAMDPAPIRKIVEAQEPAPAPEERKYSSTQFDLPEPVAERVLSIGRTIPDVDLAADGREASPHITVKWGLHTNDAEEVRRILAKVQPFDVTLGKTSFFPNGESESGDVLKVDVASGALAKLNASIAEALEHTDTHPTYKPHVTIAYLKPGRGKAYTGDDALKGTKIPVTAITFSSQTGEKITIPLGTDLQAGAAAAPINESAPPEVVSETPVPVAKPWAEMTPEERVVATQAKMVERDARKAKAAGGTLEILNPDTIGATNNGSGESSASDESISRELGLKKNGQTRVVYGRDGIRRPLIDPEHHDYVAREGETFGIEEADGTFRVLDDRGGRVPSAPAAPALPEPEEKPVGATIDLDGEADPQAALEALERETATPVSKTPKLTISIDGKTRDIESYEEAGEIIDQLRDALESEGMGGASNFPQVLIGDRETGAVVARGSYNGRIWKAVPGVHPDIEIERHDGRGYGKDKPIDVTAPPKPPVVTGPTVLGPKPTKKAKTFTRIGTNAEGQALDQDEYGVRSIVENGVRVTEPVQIIPTRAGVQIGVDRTGERAKTWEVAETIEAERERRYAEAEALYQKAVEHNSPVWQSGQNFKYVDDDGKVQEGIVESIDFEADTVNGLTGEYWSRKTPVTVPLQKLREYQAEQDAKNAADLEHSKRLRDGATNETDRRLAQALTSFAGAGTTWVGRRGTVASDDQLRKWVGDAFGIAGSQSNVGDHKGGENPSFTPEGGRPIKGKALLEAVRRITGIQSPEPEGKKRKPAAGAKSDGAKKASGEARRASKPFAYDLNTWKAEQIKAGATAAEVDNAVGESTSLGIDPTKSDDLNDLDTYMTAIESDEDFKAEQVKLGHLGNKDLIAWHDAETPAESFHPDDLTNQELIDALVAKSRDGRALSPEQLREASSTLEERAEQLFDDTPKAAVTAHRVEVAMALQRARADTGDDDSLVTAIQYLRHTAQFWKDDPSFLLEYIKRQTPELITRDLELIEEAREVLESDDVRRRQEVGGELADVGIEDQDLRDFEEILRRVLVVHAGQQSLLDRPPTNSKVIKQAQIDRERAKNKARRDTKIAELKAKLKSQANTIDPEMITIVVEIIDTYVKDGILKFREAALAFQRDMGEDAQGLDPVFEAAWELATGEDQSIAATLTDDERKVGVADEPADDSRPLDAAEPEPGGANEAGGEADAAPDGGRGESGPDRGGRDSTEPESGSGRRTRARRNRPAAGAPGPVDTDGGVAGNYRITDDDALGAGGPATKLKQNLVALKLAKAIQAANRPATVEEQQALVKYVGWGGLKTALEEARESLLDSGDMTAEEYHRAFQSSLNAHYTSPEIIRAMWAGMQQFGFERGRVLEPSMGIGHFIGLSPGTVTATQLTGVELDPVTGLIGSLLYPKSKIQITGFQDAKLPDDYFDLAISNVPFGKFGVADPGSKLPGYMRKRIHNYFFGKALQKVRPGGYIAFITTHGTMDASDDIGQQVRGYLDREADFVGAIRLPDTTFKKNAGTEVITDIIFLRRRAPGDPNRSVFKDWTKTELRFKSQENPRGIPISEYFWANPGQVIGKMGAQGTMYGGEGGEISVKYSGKDVGEQAEALMRTMADAAFKAGIQYKPQTLVSSLEPAEFAPDEILDQMFYLDAKGQVRQKVNFEGARLALKESKQGVLKSYIPLRDAFRELVATMRSQEATDAEIAEGQKALERHYSHFVKRHGDLHLAANASLINEDPFGPAVLAIEEWDPESKVATRAAIFTKRTVMPEASVATAESPAHALTVSLAETGGVSWPRIAELLSMTEEEAQKALIDAGRVFELPNGTFEITERYLSGRVRDKLAQAKLAAELDPKFASNVTALEAVQPVDLGEDRITVHLGAPWIPVDIVNGFIRHLGGRLVAKYRPVTAEWGVEEADWRVASGLSGSSREWETPYANLAKLLAATLNNQPVVIRDKDGVDQKATVEAQQKQEAIRAEFKTWVWADADRSKTLIRVYNQVHNATVLAAFDGAHLTLPGMSRVWRDRLKPHQLNAIWRAILNGNTYLAHTMGAGKTVVMAAIAMEYRRLGLAKKPIIVIPKQTLGDYSKFAQYYPTARVLIGTKDNTTGPARKQFMARIATGDWDAIVVTRDAMVRMPASNEAWREFIMEQIEELRATASTEELEEVDRPKARGGRRLSDLARKIEALEQRLSEIEKSIELKKDRGLAWEDLGIDMLLVDEAHGYRKMTLATNIRDVAGIPTGGGSKRGNDLFIKARAIHKNTPGRNMVFASGTPLVNSVAELYLLQKFLQPEALKLAGVSHFDAWASTFGRIVTKAEGDITGTKLKMKRRFAEFSNLNGLIQMFRSVMDVMMPEDLNLPTPPVTGGEAIVHSVEVGPVLKAFIRSLATRVDNLNPRDLKSDNMLKISTDGRKAALDLRLVGIEDGGQKLEAIADQVKATHKRWDAKRGTQLIFMELGVPAEGKFSTYDALRDLLVDRGIPKEQIAYIQTKSDAERDALMAKMREGQIRVLIGPRETMGTGVNVQDRLVALHHADPHWLPALIEQADGRGIRQGNRFFMENSPEKIDGFTLDINHYISIGSFDAFMWSAVAWKGRMINQAIRGNLALDKIEEIGGGAVFNAAEIAAIATGNPIMIERMQLEQRQMELQIMQASHDRTMSARARARASLPQEIEAAEAQIAALKTVQETVGAEPSVAIDGVTYQTKDDLTKANKVVRDRFAEIETLDQAKALPGARPGSRVTEDVWVPVGELVGGYQVFARFSEGVSARYDDDAKEWVKERVLHDGLVVVFKNGVSNASINGLASGPVSRLLEHVPETIATRIAAQDEAKAVNEASLAEAIAKGSATFKDADELQRVNTRLEEIYKALQVNTSEAAVPDEKDEDDDVPADLEDDDDQGSSANIAQAALDPDRPGNPRPASQGLGFKPAEAGRLTGRALDPSEDVDTVYPLELPELVRLAREIGPKGVKVVKAFRRWGQMGVFKGKKGIAVLARLFEPGRELELAAVLAHEIGHLTDWLESEDIRRGNLLGRILSLQRFLKEKFTDPSTGHTLKNSEIKKELIALSAIWRPWDRDTAQTAFKQYRDSSRELYADAISVLLNDPGQLKRVAPTFFTEFFAALDEKPSVKRAYFDLQGLLGGDREQLLAQRQGDIEGMALRGDMRSIEIIEHRLAQQKAERSWRNLKERLKQGLLNKHSPIAKMVRELEARGVTIPVQYDPRYLLAERNYLDGRVKAFVTRDMQPVYDQVTGAGVPWEQFHAFLLYERIIDGDRMDKANPGGIQPAAAEELRARLRDSWTDEQRTAVDEATENFRAAVKGIAQEAHATGLISDQTWKEIQENQAYATFRTIEHLEKDLTATIYRQKGTLDDITNVADSTILKAIVTLKAIEHNKAKVGAIRFLQRYFGVQQSDERWIEGRLQPVAPHSSTGLVMVTYKEKGRTRGVNVDPYIAQSLNNDATEAEWVTKSGITLANSIFRPVFTSINLGFQGANVWRDFWRFWKNMPAMTIGKAVRLYYEARPVAGVRAFGLASEDTSRLRQGVRRLRGKPGTAPTQEELDAQKVLLDLEESKVLSVTFNDIIKDNSFLGREPEETLIEETFVKHGALGHKPKEHIKAVKALVSILDGIVALGDYIETLPKVAGALDLGKGKVTALDAKQRAFVRERIGSPDYLAGGTWKPVTNNFFLFSNAIIQGWIADLKTATEPTTAAGYWWKTIKLNLAPKLLLMAIPLAAKALASGDGDDEDSTVADLERFYRKVSEYDKTNYIIVPLGFDANGDAVYLRLPQDDSGRLWGGILWKMRPELFGTKGLAGIASTLVDYTGGQVPSVTPVFGAVSDAYTMASGRNPYDDFRGRNVLTDEEQLARGSKAWAKFLGWEFQQLGGSILWKFYPGEAPPKEQSPLRWVVSLPVVSNVVGRFVRVSSQGERERLQDVKDEVRKQKAQERQVIKDAVSDAIRAALQQPAAKRPNVASMANTLVVDLYPKATPAERQVHFRQIRSRLTIGLARGADDPIYDKILDGSNDEKVAVLMEASTGMSKTAFLAWLKEAAGPDGPVSAQVYKETLSRLQGAKR